MTQVSVAAIQTALTDDTSKNIARVTDLVRRAAHEGAQIILPSVLCEGAYFCRGQHEEDFARARPAEGHRTLHHFQQIAADLGVVIPVSFFERAGPEHYQSVAVLDADGRNLGVYRTSHIPHPEKLFFRPGDTGFRAFLTRFGTIGVAICWDLWFPEAARAMALAGADVLFYPTAMGASPGAPDLDNNDSWQRVMIGHAVANAVAVVAANRIGREGVGRESISFYGSSFVCDARGDKLVELGREQIGYAVATVDLEQLRQIRANMGFFRDRRPALYRPLTGGSE